VAFLGRVGDELDAADVRRLLARLRAAQAGSLGLTEALRAAADELAAELHRELAEVVESAPTKLIMPILVFLMPPALVVTLAPPVQALLDTLAGAGPVPGL
jgi:pilus assembly protein TadC